MQSAAIYYLAGSSQARPVNVLLRDNEISLFCADSQQVITKVMLDELSICAALGNLPCEIKLANGELIVLPGDDQLVNKLRKQLNPASLFLANLEKNKVFWLIAIILVPLCFYSLVNYVIPAAASSVAGQVSQPMKAEIDEHAIGLYDEVMLEHTSLSLTEQAVIERQWLDLLQALDLDVNQYQLLFRASEAFGANAFALPGGTVVVTDQLVQLFTDNPEAISAILLHELAHVEYNHSMQILAESVGTTILMTYFFGDLDGIVELFSGTAVTLVQNNYSRDLESEADDYAIAKLKLLGQSPQAFVDAMQGLSEQGKDYNKLLKYFSTHPEFQQRINKASQAIE